MNSLADQTGHGFKLPCSIVDLSMENRHLPMSAQEKLMKHISFKVGVRLLPGSRPASFSPVLTEEGGEVSHQGLLETLHLWLGRTFCG